MNQENKVIVLEQKPIISYDLVEQKGKEVKERITSLNLSDIEPTEENLKLLKVTRTELKKEFTVFEDQRKMVKELVMKPYNDFDEAYKKNISSLFNDADLQLKNKVGVVDDAILKLKIDGIKAYFEEVNTFDFISFDDLQLKIIKSITDKKLKDEIDLYLTTITSTIEMINTLENKDRVLVKFQMHKDLNRAISETQIEVKKEAELKAQNEAREKAKLDQESNDSQKEINAEIEDHQEAKPTKEEPKSEEPQIFKMGFTVIGTKEQFAELKKFMNEKGISYE